MMIIEADFSHDGEMSISIEEVGIGCDFAICFTGGSCADINIQLSVDQFQELTDQLAIWGYEPSDDAKKQLEKIKSECR